MVKSYTEGYQLNNLSKLVKKKSEVTLAFFILISFYYCMYIDRFENSPLE